MNKQEYLDTLTKALKMNKVNEIDEILSEYEEHFAYKIADGYTEEEVCAKLEKPEVIAKQFVYDGGAAATGKQKGIAAKAGVCLLDVIMVMLGILLYSFILVLGAAAVGLLASGIYLLVGGGIATLPLPMMSVSGRLLLGVSMIGLAVLAAAGTVYYTLFVNQLARAYRRWHKNVMTGRISPALSTSPKLSGKMKRRLRVITRVSLFVFIIAFIIAYVLMSISANSMGFWHVWHWFN